MFPAKACEAPFKRSDSRHFRARYVIRKNSGALTDNYNSALLRFCPIEFIGDLKQPER